MFFTFTLILRWEVRQGAGRRGGAQLKTGQKQKDRSGKEKLPAPARNGLQGLRQCQSALECGHAPKPRVNV